MHSINEGCFGDGSSNLILILSLLGTDLLDEMNDLTGILGRGRS